MVALLAAAFSSALTIGTLTMTTDPAVTAPTPSRPSVSDVLFDAADRRVRAVDPKIKSLLVEGFRRSPSFAALLVALNRTDVIVYVERVMSLPKETLGRLTMVPIPGATRYLRIQIRNELTRNEAIALVGHELQHALEVAGDSSVRTADAMIALYERIGHSSGGEHVYDTVAAQDMGRQVRRELMLPAAADAHGNDPLLSVKNRAVPDAHGFAAK
jgi:hypothetical protein